MRHIATLVERNTRFTMLVKIARKEWLLLQHAAGLDEEAAIDRFVRYETLITGRVG